MLLKWNGTEVSLEYTDDFKSFKVVVADGSENATAAAKGFAGVARFEGNDTAWVYESALRDWQDLRSDLTWQKGLDFMIAKARPHGWIDDTSHSIRAHVVYEPGSPR